MQLSFLAICACLFGQSSSIECWVGTKSGYSGCSETLATADNSRQQKCDADEDKCFVYKYSYEWGPYCYFHIAKGGCGTSSASCSEFQKSSSQKLLNWECTICDSTYCAGKVELPSGNLESEVDAARGVTTETLVLLSVGVLVMGRTLL